MGNDPSLNLPYIEDMAGYFLICWAFPLAAVAVPLYMFLRDMGLLDTQIELILL